MLLLYACRALIAVARVVPPHRPPTVQRSPLLNSCDGPR
jgi:hypothetical protein